MKPLAVQRRVTEKRPVHPVHPVYPIGDEEDLRRDGDAFDDISSDDSDVELVCVMFERGWGGGLTCDGVLCIKCT